MSDNSNAINAQHISDESIEALRNWIFTGDHVTAKAILIDRNRDKVWFAVPSQEAVSDEVKAFARKLMGAS